MGKSWIKRVGRVFFLAAAISVCLPGNAAIFLEIIGPDIEGNATTAGYVDQIKVTSASWGASNPNCGGGKGATTLADFSFTKELGPASVDMLTGVDLNTVYTTIKVHFVTVGGSIEEYLTYTFSDAVLQSTSASGDGSSLPSESWSISYGSLEVRYVEFVGGKAGAPEVMTFTNGPCAP